MNLTRESTEYSAPAIVAALRPYLDLPRFQYSDDFAKYLDKESEEHEKYKEGLIAIGGMIGIIFFLWACILLILKCNGKVAGCGAGHPFKMLEPQPSAEHYSRTAEQTQTKSSGTHGSRTRNKHSSNRYFDDQSIHSSIQSFGVQDEMDSYGYNTNESLLITRREKRTQLFFWIFSIITLFCVPLITYYFFLPLKTAMESTEPQISYAQDILGELDLSIANINSAFNITTSVARKYPADFSSLCPRDSFEILNGTSYLAQVLPDVYRAFLEMAQENLQKLHWLVKNETQDIHISVYKELYGATQFHSKFEAFYGYTEIVSEHAKVYVWIVPFLLLLMASATGILMVGAYLSRTRNANEGFQKALTHGILPVIVAVSVVVWAATVGAAVATVVGDDVCNSGSNDGSPHDVILAILKTFHITPRDPLHRYISSFTGGCIDGEDPTEQLKKLEVSMRTAIEMLWETLTEIEQTGRSKLVDACGTKNGEYLEEFLSDSQILAQMLTVIQRSVGSMTGTLKCERVYPLYVETIEGTACSEIPEPVAYAIFLFFLLGVSTMGMITLRSAWRHQVEGEEIYNDEDEEIANMFVDEHEEYLAYISKYKHEWEDVENCEQEIIRAHRTAPTRPIQPVYAVRAGSGTESGNTHSDSDSEKESHLVGEDFFEDEHYNRMDANPLRAGPFDQNVSDTYSPTTDGSATEFSFMPSYIDGETSSNPFSGKLMDDDRNTRRSSSLLGPNADDDDDDLIMEKLSEAIERQSSCDIDQMQDLAHSIERQRNREILLMEKLEKLAYPTCDGPGRHKPQLHSQIPDAAATSLRIQQHPESNEESESSPEPVGAGNVPSQDGNFSSIFRRPSLSTVFPTCDGTWQRRPHLQIQIPDAATTRRRVQQHPESNEETGSSPESAGAGDVLGQEGEYSSIIMGPDPPSRGPSESDEGQFPSPPVKPLSDTDDEELPSPQTTQEELPVHASVRPKQTRSPLPHIITALSPEVEDIPTLTPDEVQESSPGALFGTPNDDEEPPPPISSFDNEDQGPPSSLMESDNSPPSSPIALILLS